MTSPIPDRLTQPQVEALDQLIREINETQLVEPKDTLAYDLLTDGLAHLITARLMLSGQVPVMGDSP